jgi:hypothetical protein
MADEKDPKDSSAKDPNTKTEGDEKPADPGYMTQEQFNKAMTARAKREEEKTRKYMEQQMAAILDRLPPLKDLDAVEEPTETAAAPEKLSKDAIETRKALKEVNELKRKMDALREENEKTQKKMRQDQLKTATTAALSELGCTRPTHALSYLEANGLVRYNDDGQLVFMARQEFQGEKFEEEKPLSEGLKGWVASPDGEIYLPPRGTQGAGTEAVRRPGNRKPTKEEAKEEAAANLLNYFRGGGRGA